MSLERNKLVGAAAAALLAGTVFGSAAADTSERVWVVFDADHKGSVQRALNANGAELHYEFGHLNAFAVSLPEQAVNGIRNNPHVVRVEADARRELMSTQTMPYGIGMVEADQVSDAQASNRTVCIIDSGFDLGHEDLPGSSQVTGTNDSGTGNWYEDGSGHGTHVAGTISAMNNDLGVIGVLPNGQVGIHIVKVFDDSGSWGYSSDLVNALSVCENNGADVINMSLGGSFSSQTEAQAFQDAYDRGVLSIAAAGNDGTTGMSYPASYDAVVSIAAIDSSKALADFSQRNEQVELAAPGVAVESTVPMGTGNASDLSVGGDPYSALAMEGSPDATGEGALMDCGLGDSTCNASGEVCLIERGDISFADKVQNCEAGGGVAAVIYNNVSGSLQGTLGETVTGIPSVGISQTDGQALLNRLGENAYVATGAGNYASFNGTSMASPHVTGVAALVWSHHSTCTNQEIRDALAATAEDLGTAGRDNNFGHGLVRARAAVDYLDANGCSGDDGGGDTNTAPTADFTFACTDLACDFDGSGSADSDGSIASHAWDFGDGSSGSGEFASHSYASAGDYTVTLTVTDDDGATDSVSQTVSVTSGGDGGDSIDLSANGYKEKGRHHADLTWSGASTSQVDVYRNGTLEATVSNSGAWTWSSNIRGGDTHTFEVCEAGSDVCSNSATAAP